MSMPANFLIVCGGTGKGIVSRHKELGFIAAMQIDVQKELVSENDGRMFKFPLPIEDATEQSLNSVNSLVQYQRRLITQKEKSHAKAGHATALDDCQHETCGDLTRQINHVSAAISKASPVSLAEGMSQNPIIGRSYVTRPNVTSTLRSQISQMIQLRPNDMDDVIVWIVASTCGGTGNGIVHHVADVVEDVAGTHRLTIKFVRVGSLTYKSLNQFVHLSTLWSVLTDYGYMRNHTLNSQVGRVSSQIHTYYLDLPDVGLDKPSREALVLSAFSAISDRGLVARFNSVLNNVTPSVVLARVGEWGRGFDRNSVYQHSLIQLKAKLDMLLNPSISDMLLQSTGVSLLGVEGLDDALAKKADAFRNIANNPANQATWTNLKRMHVSQLPTDVSSIRQMGEWSAIESLVSKFIDTAVDKQTLIEKLKGRLVTDQEQFDVVFNSRDANEALQQYIATPDYINEVRLAQRTRARIHQKLLGDSQHRGMLFELFEAWNTLLPEEMQIAGRAVPSWIASQFVENTARSNKIIEGIQQLLRMYIQVLRYVQDYSDATDIAYGARDDLAPLSRVVNTQRENMGTLHTHQLTEAAELEETFGARETWLLRLLNVLSGDVNLAIETGAFRRVVEMGARGLTEEGLKYVLETPSTANISNMVRLMNEQVGSNNAVWWQGMNPSTLGDGQMYTFRYRVFPKLPERLMNMLRGENIEWGQNESRPIPDYIQIASTSLGLKVYAVECAVPGKLDIDQIRQMVARLKGYIDPEHSMYPTASQVGSAEAEKFYLAHQCQRSQGLKVRCPEVFKEFEPELYQAIHALDDYFVITSE
jgi:hypothetical protein